jgi:hypothetical protein
MLDPGGMDQGQFAKRSRGMAVQKSMQHHPWLHARQRDVRGRDSGRASTRAREELGSREQEGRRRG